MDIYYPQYAFSFPLKSQALSYAARFSWERERRAVSSGDDDKLALSLSLCLVNLVKEKRNKTVVAGHQPWRIG
uniref:Uncharacterized protein n=1 Tax=Oryza barthii TaxID=65489 RepID=A0A0D3GCJ8_9ORYZ